jgi:hypothetical protein
MHHRSINSSEFGLLMRLIAAKHPTLKRLPLGQPLLAALTNGKLDNVFTNLGGIHILDLA